MLAIGVGTLLVFANLFLAAQVRHEASSVLQARAEAEIVALNLLGGRVRERPTPNEASLDRSAWIFTGSRLTERPPGVGRALDAAAIALTRSPAGTERDVVDHVRLRAEPILSPRHHRRLGTVVVGYSVRPLEVLQNRVLVGSLVFAALILLTGAAVIVRAVRSALQPVAVMMAEAEDWGAHDLDRRFDLGPVRDELTGLGAVLDGLLSRIAASRRHEQRFAGDVAHELRTPIAAIRGRAELALMAEPGEAAEAERQQALRAVIAQADRLDQTVNALLEVARREHDSVDGVVELTGLAADFPDVEVHLPARLPAVEGDPVVIRQILAPLVENARRYARASVRLEVAADAHSVRIAVRDDGPGVDPELGELLFEPGVRGTQAAGSGAGLGLPLARRLARACGGDVLLAPGPGGHFVVKLAPVRNQGDAGQSFDHSRPDEGSKDISRLAP
jgi:signal transduction histidine kinase